MSDKNVTPQPGPAPDCGEMRKEKKRKALTLEEMKEMHIGASHEQPPEGAETSGMAPLPEVEFIKNVGKAVSYMADTASSAVEAVENFLNDCACEVSSWNWGFFNSLLDGARGYSGEGGGFSRNKFWGAVTKGTHNFVFGTVKGLLNMIGHPVETAKGIGHAVTHPKELLNGLKEQYWGSRKNWAEKVSGVTEAVCDIAFLAYGAKKGFDKLSKGAKARKAAKIAESRETAGEAAKVGGKGKVRIESRGGSGNLIPQGFTKKQFDKFAEDVIRFSQNNDLPDGKLMIHGSRAKGTATSTSDIDIILRVDKSTFDAFAARRLSTIPEGTRLYKTIMKAVKKQKLSVFDISKDFGKNLHNDLIPLSPIKNIDFSITVEDSPFDEGPFIDIN